MVLFWHSQGPQVCLTVPSGEEAEIKRCSDQEVVSTPEDYCMYTGNRCLGWVSPIIGLCCFRVTPSHPPGPCRQLRPTKPATEWSLGTLMAAGCVLMSPPHHRITACNHDVTSQPCSCLRMPILRTEDRESQEYVTFHSCRALLVPFHRGLRGSHSLSPELFDTPIPSRSPSACFSKNQD